MSKTLFSTRMALVGFLALLQLMLLPAAQMLHMGCHHAHADVAVDAAGDVASELCWSSHCCGHCRKPATSADNPSLPSQPERPVKPLHDGNSCPVCQAVFAARLATGMLLDLPTVEPLREFLAVDSQSACPTPRYCVLSRGPPQPFFG